MRFSWEAAAVTAAAVRWLSSEEDERGEQEMTPGKILGLVVLSVGAGLLVPMILDPPEDEPEAQ